jgi:hypothetical protein
MSQIITPRYFETFFLCFDNTRAAVNEFTEVGFANKELLDRSLRLFKAQYDLYLTLKSAYCDRPKPSQSIMSERVPTKASITTTK